MDTTIERAEQRVNKRASIWLSVAMICGTIYVLLSLLCPGQ